MKKEAIVTFERKDYGTVKTTKTRRKNIPGIIERQEINRAESIESDLWLKDLVDKYSWYPID